MTAVRQIYSTSRKLMTAVAPKYRINKTSSQLVWAPCKTPKIGLTLQPGGQQAKYQHSHSNRNDRQTLAELAHLQQAVGRLYVIFFRCLPESQIAPRNAARGNLLRPLAGSYLGAVDRATGQAAVLEPPTENQGARRVWSDTSGRLWIREWNAGQLARYVPPTGEWREWRLPGDHLQPYSVYIDEQDQVWLSDFGANALHRFDPSQENFEVFVLYSAPANGRQILDRPGEIWGAESGVDQLVLVRTR